MNVLGVSCLYHDAAAALLRDNKELLGHYQRRFQHLMVDEFQDTNAIQYAWLRLLAGKTGVPFVVGDDDQSMFDFRVTCANRSKCAKGFDRVKRHSAVAGQV